KLKAPNKALYTQLVLPSGGTVDDLIVYQRENDFLLVVNASNIDKNWNWLQQNKERFRDLQLKNISDEMALIALQGPKAAEILSRVSKLPSLKAFEYGGMSISGVPVHLSRTGYTGEDGFEIFVSADGAGKLWTTLLEAGSDLGLQPCGLGAR